MCLCYNRLQLKIVGNESWTWSRIWKRKCPAPGIKNRLVSFHKDIYITSNHGLQNIPPPRPNCNIKGFFLQHFYVIHWEAQNILVWFSCARAHENTDRLSAVILSCGQFDALLKNMTSISSDLIGQILLWCQFQPITYGYVLQLEIIFRLWVCDYSESLDITYGLSMESFTLFEISWLMAQIRAFVFSFPASTTSDSLVVSTAYWRSRIGNWSM